MEHDPSQPPVSDLERRIAERVAGRIVDLVRDELGLRPPTREWIDAKEVARRWGFSRAWVYAHARQLGAVPAGDGPRPRLRFDAELVAEAVRGLGKPQAGGQKLPVAESAQIHMPRVRAGGRRS